MAFKLGLSQGLSDTSQGSRSVGVQPSLGRLPQVTDVWGLRWPLTELDSGTTGCKPSALAVSDPH